MPVFPLPASLVNDSNMCDGGIPPIALSSFPLWIKSVFFNWILTPFKFSITCCHLSVRMVASGLTGSPYAFSHRSVICILKTDSFGRPWPGCRGVLAIREIALGKFSDGKWKIPIKQKKRRNYIKYTICLWQWFMRRFYWILCMHVCVCGCWWRRRRFPYWRNICKAFHKITTMTQVNLVDFLPGFWKRKLFLISIFEDFRFLIYTFIYN